MDDKEVGELWRWCKSPTEDNDKLIDEMRGLIRKLVEERVKLYVAKRVTQGMGTTAEEAKTLRDFGIDPESWRGEGNWQRKWNRPSGLCRACRRGHLRMWLYAIADAEAQIANRSKLWNEFIKKW